MRNVQCFINVRRTKKAATVLRTEASSGLVALSLFIEFSVVFMEAKTRPTGVSLKWDEHEDVPFDLGGETGQLQCLSIAGCQGGGG